ACHGCFPGWISGAPTWSASRRRRWPMRRSPSCSATSCRGAATRLPPTVSRPGTGWRSSRRWGSRTSCAALTGPLDFLIGLRDVVRDRWPHERVFTYWDYRAGMFHQDLGMRIDLVLASGVVADRVQAAWVDRHARKGTGPSDHAPVIVDLDEAPDGDIGPVVPPPSAPARRRG